VSHEDIRLWRRTHIRHRVGLLGGDPLDLILQIEECTEIDCDVYYHYKIEQELPSR
jgi:hypothetical protein